MSSEVKRHFFLWVKNHCPFCESARELLESSNTPHTIYDVTEETDTLTDVQENIGVFWKTVPLIIEQTSSGKRTFIGGFTDLEKYLEEKDEQSIK